MAYTLQIVPSGQATCPFCGELTVIKPDKACKHFVSDMPACTIPEVQEYLRYNQTEAEHMMVFSDDTASLEDVQWFGRFKYGQQLINWARTRPADIDSPSGLQVGQIVSIMDMLHSIAPVSIRGIESKHSYTMALLGCGVLTDKEESALRTFWANWELA